MAEPEEDAGTGEHGDRRAEERDEHRGTQQAPEQCEQLRDGGVQAVQRDQTGSFWGGGDPRRGGAAIVVSDECGD